LRTYQPEHAVIARENRRENRKELANMLGQIAMERAARLPPPSLEAQFQASIRKVREDVQHAKDVQSAHILRWLQS
jgi:hypothetical protein